MATTTTPDRLIARTLVEGGRAMADALLDLGLPSTCAACDEPGGPLCPPCERDLRAGLFDRPRRSMPDPVPIHLPPVSSRGPYAGVLRRLVSAYKDDGRRDLRPLLAQLLAESLAVASAGRSVVVVPMPSSRAAVRRRGDDPVADLVTAAAAQVPGWPTVRRVLRPLRRLEDQSALDRRERALNLSGAYGAPQRRSGRHPGPGRGPGRRRGHHRRHAGGGGPRGASQGWAGGGCGHARRDAAPSLGAALLRHGARFRRAALRVTVVTRSPALSRMGGGPSVSRACQARGEPSPTARRTTWTTTWTSS